MEIKFKDNPPEASKVQEALKNLNLGEIAVNKTSGNEIIVKMKTIDEATHGQILEKLTGLGEIEPGSENFENIGPTIGQELKRKTNIVVFLTLLGILIYIALSFRRISRPVKSYLYGLAGIIALFHDVLIPLGVFSVLGKLYGVEITIPIITALLAVFGYSINDSVVVFDRIRENLLKSKNPTFAGIVEESLNQTLVRSLNTTFTTLLSLFAIFFFGGASLKYFSLTLMIGIGLGAYSSFFIAALLMVTYYEWRERGKGRF